MPSAITHAAVAVAAGIGFAPKDVPPCFWSLAIACSILPDADTLGLPLGIPYSHFWGHRGFFHSPFWGLMLGLFIPLAFFGETHIFSRRWFFYMVFFFLLSAGHGILDAFTSGGLGIALLSPFSNARYFFPWRPIVVSPIGITPFFSHWGVSVLKSEFTWVWVPSYVIAGISLLFRKLFAGP